MYEDSDENIALMQSKVLSVFMTLEFNGLSLFVIAKVDTTCANIRHKQKYFKLFHNELER